MEKRGEKRGFRMDKRGEERREGLGWMRDRRDQRRQRMNMRS